jgi:hypothetical protein
MVVALPSMLRHRRLGCGSRTRAALQPWTKVEKESRRHKAASEKECVFSVVAIDSFRVNHNFEGIPERRSKKQDPSDESAEFQLDNRQQKEKAVRKEGTQDIAIFEPEHAEQEYDDRNRNVWEKRGFRSWPEEFRTKTANVHRSN